MSFNMILASGSQIRGQLLRNAGLTCETMEPRIDEDTVKASLISEGASPRDIADVLAEAKARKVSAKAGAQLVLGCDQVLDFKGQLLSKPETQAEAVQQLQAMSNQRHHLFSAAVLYENNEPIWRHVGKVTLNMRALSDAYIDAYVTRNWDSIQHSVGCYKLEEEGVRLFTRVDGDYFNVLGLPLIELVNYLVLRGLLET